MHLIDRIGPYLGVVSFLALTVLVVLLFLQAREVRRLREWAGRAPERALEAAEATGAAAEARGEAAAPERDPLRTRIAGFFSRIGARINGRFGPAYRELDRRSPVDPRIVLAVLAALAIAAGVVTGGFGLGGSGGSGSKQAAVPKPGKTEVAVLNGSQEQGVTGQPGLAHTVLAQVVKPAGYRTGAVTNAPHSFPKSIVLYANGQSAAASQLAATATKKLGSVKTQPMSSDVQAVVDGAPLALVVGVDDASFGS
jgi:LytR cell envelope-related transcriptional attenuator